MLKDRKMNKLHDQLPVDEQNEDEGIFTIGDSIAYQFFCGNWSSTIKEMKAENISCKDFSQWLEDFEESIGEPCDFTKWFDREFFAQLGREVRYN
tara:strand:- start:1111 stop:1395 length:285 start_codon:yes stop_codon:yes gene_type:complete